MRGIYLMVLLCCFLWSSICFADTLVIKFKSGKTQEVILDDRSEAVEGIQFQGSQKDAAKTAQPQQAGDNSQKAEREGKTDSKNKNQGIRLKWAEPKTGE